jgi:hypothetical protein
MHFGPVFPRPTPTNIDERLLAPGIGPALEVVLRARPIADAPRPLLYPPLARRRPIGPSVPQLVALVGRPQAGKDVVADYASAEYTGVARLAYSDPIIAEVNQALAPSGHRIGSTNKSLPMYRRLLQDWATARRRQAPEYWTEQVEQLIDQQRQAGARLILVTGARDLRDVALIRRQQGVLWKVLRPDHRYQAEHAIERALDHLDDEAFAEHIVNPVSGQLALFESNIRRVLDR